VDGDHVRNYRSDTPLCQASFGQSWRMDTPTNLPAHLP
jgi:hypothetical protein